MMRPKIMTFSEISNTFDVFYPIPFVFRTSNVLFAVRNVLKIVVSDE